MRKIVPTAAGSAPKTRVQRPFVVCGREQAAGRRRQRQAVEIPAVDAFPAQSLGAVLVHRDDPDAGRRKQLLENRQLTKVP